MKQIVQVKRGINMNKRLFIAIVIILVLCIIGVGGYLLLNRGDSPEQNEILPQEEMGDEQMRQTIVTLYYQNKDTKELMPEGRMIDSKTLLTDPYGVLMGLLIEGPKGENLQSVIPQGTKVLKTEIKEDIVYVDLSKEFINNHSGGLEGEKTTIKAIVNTLTELNEVNSVKILIDGKEDQSFKDKKMNFKEPFNRNLKDKNDSKENKTTNNTTETKTN